MRFFNIKFLQYEKKLHLRSKPVTKFGSFLVGMVFGFGWTPCVGPILGGILMLAATKDSLVKGVLLCPLTSNPYSGALYGAILGLLFALMKQ